VLLIALQTELEQGTGPDQTTKHPSDSCRSASESYARPSSEGSDEPHATGAGSTAVKHLAIANTQCDREPQEAIDISIIRNIDLM